MRRTFDRLRFLFLVAVLLAALTLAVFAAMGEQTDQEREASRETARESSSSRETDSSGEASRETSSSQASSGESSSSQASSEAVSSARDGEAAEASEDRQPEQTSQNEAGNTGEEIETAPTQPPPVIRTVAATTEELERTVETADGPVTVEAVSYMVRAEAAVALLNESRMLAGREPLAADAFLGETALLRAMELPFRFGHERPDGTAWYTVADNPGNAACELLGRNMEGEGSAVEAWRASPGHRAAFLSADYTRVGAACVEVDGGFYWALLLGV